MVNLRMCYEKYPETLGSSPETFGSAGQSKCKEQ